MLTHDTTLLLELLSRRVIDARGCWRWQGGKSGGYGYLRGVGVHVLMYRIVNGPLAPGMCVLHRCDVRDCFNPDHLFSGTKGDNNKDRAAKGRNHDKRGERHHMAQLSAADVRAIRAACVGLRGEQAALARRYGVKRSTIGAIVRRVSWSHLP